MKKYNYILNGLDCANCARKIENHLNKDDRYKDVKINFSTLKLSFQTSIEDDVLKITEKLIKEIEPDVTIINNEYKKNNISTDIIQLILGILLLILSIIIKNNLISNILLILSYIVLLSKTFITALKLLKRKTLNENMLITISCIGAYLIDKQHEGIMVIILYSIGKILEAKAVNNTRKSISSLMDIKPEYANVYKDKKKVKISPIEVKKKDIIVVKPGEKVPLDGIIVKGTSNLDVSSLTGESKLQQVKKDDEILSGSINKDGTLEILVTEIYEKSTVNKILNLVENATDNKAKTENFVSKAAKIYTPIVIILAIMVIILFPLIFNISLKNSIYRALTFLVISCPCAIAISVPLSYFSGIGCASKNGILIKGSNYLDALRKINTIVFDKTGTLTYGNFTVSEIVSLDKKYTKEDIFKYIYIGELYSNHPIGKSIINYKKINVKKYDLNNYKEYSGKGISYIYDNDVYKIGSSNFVKYKEKDSNIYLSINNKVIGYIVLEDTIKETTIKAINELKKLNINIKIFTGDNKEIALKIGNKLSIKNENIYSELLPDDKYMNLRKLISVKEKNEVVAFVGDGINDSPSLALADIGISMGLNGSSAAIEASDVVIMQDNLCDIVKAINISKRTNKIIIEDLIFSIGTKILILILSSLGLCGMWEAVFADVGVTVLAILNTLRILRK